jgi:hypothetical protein
MGEAYQGLFEDGGVAFRTGNSADIVDVGGIGADSVEIMESRMKRKR